MLRLAIVKRVEDDGWIPFDDIAWHVILSAIQISYDQIVVVSKIIGYLLISWLKPLAVTTPRCIIINNHFFSWILRQLIMIRTNKLFEWSITLNLLL